MHCLHKCVMWPRYKPPVMNRTNVCVLVIFGLCLNFCASIREVCYDSTGCISVGPPFISNARQLPLPMSPDELNTEIYLYQEPNGNYSNVTVRPTLTLDGSPYDSSLETFVIIHGANSSGFEPWIRQIKNVILQSRNANVFVVDWSRGSMYSRYNRQSITNTLVVGRHIGLLLVESIHFLDDRFNGSRLEERAERTTIVGHSLGAHIAGYASKYVKKCLNLTIGSIVALDAANKWFEFFDAKVRISKADANRLIAIHTSSLPFTMYGCSMMEPFGHVDLYFNGGLHQPQAPPPTNPEKYADPKDFAYQRNVAALLAHSLAHQYYIEMLHHPECTFLGCKVPKKDLTRAFKQIVYYQYWEDFRDIVMNCSYFEVNAKTILDDWVGSYIVLTADWYPFCIKEGLNGTEKYLSGLESMHNVTRRLLEEHLFYPLV